MEHVAKRLPLDFLSFTVRSLAILLIHSFIELRTHRVRFSLAAVICGRVWVEAIDAKERDARADGPVRL